MNNSLPLTQVAHERLASVLKPGDVVVDATLGNGHDAVFLYQRVSPGGILYGFDLQARALELTRLRLSAEVRDCEFRFVHASHAQLRDHIDQEHHGRLAAIVYNLGYLPGGTKELTTRLDSTLQSLEQAVALLQPSGMLSVVCYQGHEEGLREMTGVERWSTTVSEEGDVEWLEAPSSRRAPPKLLILTRRRD